jgi:hypothetical protein
VLVSVPWDQIRKLGGAIWTRNFKIHDIRDGLRTCDSYVAKHDSVGSTHFVHRRVDCRSHVLAVMRDDSAVEAMTQQFTQTLRATKVNFAHREHSPALLIFQIRIFRLIE